MVGSYVGKSSEQLEKMRELCPWMDPVELQVAELAAGGTAWEAEEARWLGLGLGLGLA